MGIKIFYSNQAVLCFRPKTVVVSRLPRQSFWREHLTVPSIHRDRLGFEHTNRPSRLWPAISMSLESPFFFFACFITLFIKSEQYSKTFKKKRGPTAVSPLPTIAANYSMSVISSLHTHLCFALQRYGDFSIRAIPKTDETSSQHQFSIRPQSYEKSPTSGRRGRYFYGILSGTLLRRDRRNGRDL